MTTYGPFPRGADGRILLDDDLCEDDPAPAPVEPEAAPAPAAPSSAPPRRPGDTPTPFDQLRPAKQPAPGQQSRRGDWIPWLAAGLLLAVAGWAVWTGGALRSGGRPDEAATAAATAAPPEGAVAPPAPTPAAVLSRAVVAFDAPDGQVVGALEPGRGYTLLAEHDGWRQLDVVDSGVVWVRAWEMDGQAPPAPTAAPLPPAPAPAPAAQPVGPAVTCVPVLDGDNGNAYIGDACGASSAERQARALELLAAAPPPTLAP